MARSDQESTAPVVPTHRHRWTWITVLTIALVSGSALVAVPAIAQSDATPPAVHTPAPAEKVVVCESGVVDQGDGIRTSSAAAERVPADAPVPEGCRAG